MMSNRGTEEVRKSAKVIKTNSLEDKGMAIGGITVGVSALAICLWHFNWFTFCFSLVGGILLSAIACASKRENNVMVMLSIVCSSIALIVGLINYSDVLNPIINCLTIAAWLLEQVKEVWNEWASAMHNFLYL